MFKEFHTIDRALAKEKIGEWMGEHPTPNKIEVLVSGNGISFGIAAGQTQTSARADT